MSGRLWTAVLATIVSAASVAAEEPSAATFNTAGVQAYEAGQWQQAIDAFSQAYRLAPDNPTVRRNLCNAYQAAANEVARTADFATAAELLEAAIAADPRNASPLVQLGSYYLRLNLVQDALFRLKEAVELDPKSVVARELLGDAYYRDNNLREAIAQWEWVLEAEPKRPGLKEKLEKANREGAVEAKFGRGGSRHFVISYAPGTGRDDQNRVLSVLERAFIEVGQKFGGVYPPTPINVIIYTAKDFAEATQLGEHVGAVYDGKIRVPLKDEAGQSLPDDELRRRLYHEYVHVVVRFLANDNVPWWLNEGLAETFSRTGDEDDDLLLLREAYRQGSLFSLETLTGDQLDRLSPEALRLAYAQSYATASLLWNRFGQAPLASLMTALAEGKDPEIALQESYRRNYALLEREVANALAKH
jgi:tetratricopeptide (TPR) repeat protein